MLKDASLISLSAWLALTAEISGLSESRKCNWIQKGICKIQFFHHDCQKLEGRWRLTIKINPQKTVRFSSEIQRLPTTVNQKSVGHR